MYKERTVFIIGAGASWHYGYPTGEQLIRRVIQRANETAQYFRRSASYGSQIPKWVLDRHTPQLAHVSDVWPVVERECLELSRRLEAVNPLLIDYFLGQNPQLQIVGRTMIAWEILQCEARWVSSRKNRNRRLPEESNAKDDWYRFVLHELVSGCSDASSLLSNDVTFVTFNYDISLEDEIFRRLSAIELFERSPQYIKQFFEGNRFIHVYGSIRAMPSPEPKQVEVLMRALTMDVQDVKNRDSWQTVLDLAYESAKRLSTIDPTEKSNNATELKAAAEAIASAKRVFIVGYGFDENNSARLDLNRSLKLTDMRVQKRVHFTNFGDSNRVNRLAGRLLTNDQDKFLPSNPPVGYFAHSWCEKSVRNVYDAFELDFDPS